jgi:hypothetical protein
MKNEESPMVELVKDQLKQPGADELMIQDVILKMEYHPEFLHKVTLMGEEKVLFSLLITILFVIENRSPNEENFNRYKPMYATLPADTFQRSIGWLKKHVQDYFQGEGVNEKR